MEKIHTARAVAALLASRVSRPGIPVRSAFIVSTSDTPPPLTQLLRGGRGGEVKVKLLLSMLWIAVAAPYDVTQPARVWAELIGLQEPELKGAARVNAAVRKLVEGGFLSVERRKGLPSRLVLREETGSGEPYTHPGSHWEPMIGSVQKPKGGPHYMQIPAEFWTNGWIALLSAPAVAMFLILLEQARGKNFEGLWFSPSVAAKRYGLSEVTRRKGIEELDAVGLIRVERIPVGRGSLSTIRRRNSFSIELEQLRNVTADKGVKAPFSSPSIEEQIRALNTL